MQLAVVPLPQHLQLPGRESRLRSTATPELLPMPGEPLTLVEACDGLSFVAVESAALFLRDFVTRGWFCGFITGLLVRQVLQRGAHVWVDQRGVSAYVRVAALPRARSLMWR